MKGNHEPVIEARDVVKIYHMGGVRFEALKGVSFAANQGEILSIVGPSGSGKSTLLNLLGLLDKPSSGKVFIAGKDASKLSEEACARIRNRKIGFVFQAYNLIQRLTALENVEMPLIAQGLASEKRRDLALKVLDAVGLASKAQNRPNELSGGEQQRVGIARALVTSPSIVLGDEPTGNVDSKTALKILDLLKKFNEDFRTTFIIVTHNLEVAFATQRIIQIRDGLIEKDELNQKGSFA